MSDGMAAQGVTPWPWNRRAYIGNRSTTFWRALHGAAGEGASSSGAQERRPGLPGDRATAAAWAAERQFIPPRPQRELRDLTGHRTQRVEEKTRTASRIQQVLEDANLKPAWAATGNLGG